MGKLKDEFFDAMESADDKGNFMFFNKSYNIHQEQEDRDPGSYGDES